MTKNFFYIQFNKNNTFRAEALVEAQTTSGLMDIPNYTDTIAILPKNTHTAFKNGEWENTSGSCKSSLEMKLKAKTGEIIGMIFARSIPNLEEKEINEMLPTEKITLALKSLGN